MTSMNLFGDDLSGADEFSNRLFNGLHYESQKIVNKTFIKCTFQNCRFNNVILQKCHFEDCAFRQCELSLIKIPNSSFVDVEFDESKMLGINWTEASTATLSINFLECILDYSSFFGIGLSKSKLIKCSAKEVDFAEADLRDSKLINSDLKGSRFLKTDLRKADLTGARNYSISPTHNKIQKAKFSIPDVIGLLSEFDIRFE